jgi:hypothetical protein
MALSQLPAGALPSTGAIGREIPAFFGMCAL